MRIPLYSCFSGVSSERQVRLPQWGCWGPRADNHKRTEILANSDLFINDM